MSVDIKLARQKPLPRSQRPELNRARQYKREEGEPDDISVSLMDMDGAIMHYFEKVIKPTVFENGEQVKVPLMYASPERWASINKNGFLRDSKRRIILPVVAYRRTGMEKDDTMAVDKIDPQDPKLFYTFERKYNDRNRYDNFSIQQGLMPQREYYNVAVPDYMILNYDFIIFTSYIEQMNKLVERINWSAGSYWGEPGKMRFRTNVETFTDASETDGERLIKTTFTVQLHGYILPEAFNKLITTKKYLTPKQIILKTDVDVQLASLIKPEEGVQEIRVSQARKDASDAKTTLTNGLTMLGGTGVSVVNGVNFTGEAATSTTFAIGQDVGTSSEVLFSAVSASNSLHIGPTSFEISQRPDGHAQVDTDWHVLGDIIAENYIVSSSVTHMTQSFASGSNIFGDSIDDNQIFTGSMDISGSISLNGSSITAGGSEVSTFDEYVRKQFVKKAGSLVGTNTASFTAVTASAPSGLTTTNENDFIFFINGQYMEHDALTIEQSGSSFLLQVDTTSIGYSLESDDEIIAQGKFNS